MLILLAGSALCLSGCDEALRSIAAHKETEATGAPAEASTGGFPRAGLYDIVHETPDGRREPTNRWVDAASPKAFEELVAADDGSNCRDRMVTIGHGTFSVRMTCDAPDGDLHNIGIQRYGSYTERSIDETIETNLMGHFIREMRTYRFSKPA
jgi:hypothetical protein